MQGPNEITAFAAIILLALAAWLMRGALTKNFSGSLFWLTMAVRIVCLTALARMITWDVVIAAVVAHDADLRDAMRAIGNLMNAVYNLAYIGAALCVGKAAILMVPISERSDWNLLNIWFYPRHFFWKDKT